MTVTTLFSDARTIAGVVNGEFSGSSARPIRDVQVDSRSCDRDSLFVALSGTRTDGHRFLGDAFRRGSSLSFVSRHFYEKHQAEISGLCEECDAGVVVVDDPLEALQALAADRMRQLDTMSIAITGSNGKTTTKNLIGAMLGAWRSTAVSPGNFNSDIGLPLSCMQVKEEHRYAVFEMGMNRPGEIAELVEIVRPRVAAITNIGSAHIGLLGSQRAIAMEKRNVFAWLPPDGRGFVSEAEPFRRLLSEGLSGLIDEFGPETTPGFESAEDLGLAGTAITLWGRKVRFPLIGKHQLSNALCAVSVASWLGAPQDLICDALSEARAEFGRGEVLEGRVTAVLDCYNANRQSVLRAIELLDSISTTGRKVLILGSMLELGEHADAEHRAVGRAAAESDAALLVFVGNEARPAYEAAATVGRNDPVYFETYDSLEDTIGTLVTAGDLVLIKGSRSLELERLLGPIGIEREAKE